MQAMNSNQLKLTKIQSGIQNVKVIFRHSEVQSQVELCTHVFEQWKPHRSKYVDSQEIFGSGRNAHLKIRLLVTIANAASVLFAHVL